MFLYPGVKVAFFYPGVKVGKLENRRPNPRPEPTFTYTTSVNFK